MTTLVVAMVVSIALGTGTWTWMRMRHQRSAVALRALGTFARNHGGSMTLDLVDGQVYLDLRGTRLSAEDMRALPQLWQQCLSSDLDGRCDVDLDLAGARLEANLVGLLSKQIVGLRLANLVLVDDRMVERIAQTSPHIHVLKLDGTAVSDKCFEYVRLLPIRSLSLENTHVSIRGIARLRECPQLYELYISKSGIGSEELKMVREMLPGCNVYCDSPATGEGGDNRGE